MVCVKLGTKSGIQPCWWMIPLMQERFGKKLTLLVQWSCVAMMVVTDLTWYSWSLLNRYRCAAKERLLNVSPAGRM